MLLTLPLKSDFYLSPRFITKKYDKKQQKMVSLLNEMRLQFKGRCTKLHGDNSVSRSVAMAMRTVLCCFQWIPILNC